MSESIATLARYSLPLGVRAAVQQVRHVLPVFEEASSDKRPRHLLDLAERWARSVTHRDALDVTALADVVHDLAFELPWTGGELDALAIHIAFAASDVGYMVRGNHVTWHAESLVEHVSIIDSDTDNDTNGYIKTIGWHPDDIGEWSWTAILDRVSLSVHVPRFPYVDTRGPVMVFFGDADTCWTLAELRKRRRSRVTSEILVALDAAMEGRRL